MSKTLQGHRNVSDVLRVCTQHEKSNQILHADEIRCEENFCRPTTPPAVARIFGDTNPDARPVCGS